MENTFQERKETVYRLLCDDLYVPMKAKEIAMLLDVQMPDREALKEVLDALVAEGKAEVTARGKYIRTEGKLLTGVFRAHPRGFGFVTADGEETDIFIPETQVNGAFHMDTVQIALTAGTVRGRRREGKVTKILARGMTHAVCTYEAGKGAQGERSYGFAVPDNQKFGRDIFIPAECSMGAVTGHKVVVEITNYGGEGKNPAGKVTEILGHSNDPGCDILSIVRGFDLPVEFPERMLHQAARAAKPVSPADMEGRTDLRDLLTVTIDGEDAKDLDDAVTLTREGELWRLGVHIADVSNYVQENSALDVEALKRGNSVYLVDRVIPMLPHALSNGICSLNEGEDRLALSCIMTIDAKGNVTDHVIAETVIRVNRRMSYTGVAKILDDPKAAEKGEYGELVPMIAGMGELAAVLRKKRMRRGSIDFDFPETKILLDSQGKPTEIRPYDRNAATKMIEDFMLAANETVAQDYFWQDLPFLYRTHDNPDPEKIRTLSAFIHNFGYSIRIGQDELHPKELQKLLGSIEGTPEELLISRLALRSMKQARYSATADGHFGLAAAHYCHFTSPIRRYPDLQIHRIIKDTLRGRMNEERITHYEKRLPEVAKQTSQTERTAAEAERETERMKKAEYMEERIGERYEGVISGVTEWGFFVELANTVEGMVHVTSLEGDYYVFHADRYELAGETTGISYKLGQKVQVEVVRADRQMRTIDFNVVNDGTF